MDISKTTVVGEPDEWLLRQVRNDPAPESASVVTRQMFPPSTPPPTAELPYPSYFAVDRLATLDNPDAAPVLSLDLMAK